MILQDLSCYNWGTSHRLKEKQWRVAVKTSIVLAGTPETVDLGARWMKLDGDYGAKSVTESVSDMETITAPFPESFEKLNQQPVFLVSGEMPGCGSSTVANGLQSALESFGEEVECIHVGDRIRELLDVASEAELHANLGNVPSAGDFDRQIYASLPPRKAVVIDGKAATRIGPDFIDGRPVIAIDLQGDSLISAARVLQREGHDIFRFEQDYLENLFLTKEHIETRVESDRQRFSGFSADFNQDLCRHSFDTTLLHPREIIDPFTGTSDYALPLDWEIHELSSLMASFYQHHVQSRGGQQDAPHVEYLIEGLRYKIQRLNTSLDPEAVANIREDIRSQLCELVFGALIKSLPRAAMDATTGAVQLDEKSIRWSPEYYKLAQAWSSINVHLQGHTILDPFGGSGSLGHVVSATGIAASVTCADLAYPGGSYLNGEPQHYRPDINWKVGSLFFDRLPSWYRLPANAKPGYVTADACKLPFANEQFDAILTDPPFGKNYEAANSNLFLESLPELMRVVKEHALIMVPLAWLEDLKANGLEFTQLTSDVSDGYSHFPVCYIKIRKDR